MNQETWTAVDGYFAGQLLPPDAALDAALAASAAAGLPGISVSPAQGKLLHLLARACGARRILEIGTLGGYSTIWLARALAPGGRVVTLDINPVHVGVARANLARAGLADRVDVRLGSARETLGQLAAEGAGPFDFVFIDADKPSTADYFDAALAMSRPGTLIVIDNVARKGAVLDASGGDPDVEGMRRCLARMAAEPRVSATALQTVGSKGYDGFALAIVNAPR